jgi:hypothetical protein
MSKAFGEQNPTLGEDPVSWQTFTNGAGVIPDVVGDVDWGKLKLDLLGQEGRSAVYDLGAAATRKFTLTENRYGTGAETATIQIRGDTSSFAQDDVTPAWETYTAPASKGYRYVQVRATTVVLGWWLSGGISAANCIAAYQPKGAADLAGSYINKANPSTYDAAPGTAPTWNATNGWIFLSTSSQYLRTGLTGADGWSAICRYSNFDGPTNGCIFAGNAGAGALFGIQWNSSSEYYPMHQSYATVSEALVASGVIAIAGQDYYLDHVYKTTIGTTPNVYREIYIGSSNNGSANNFCKVYIQAFALYDITLSAPQVIAVTDAMTAL